LIFITSFSDAQDGNCEHNAKGRKKPLDYDGSEMRVAYVHDWLVTYRGGEKVLESLLKLYPEAPIYTLFYDPKRMPESIRKRQIVAPKWLKPFTRVRKGLLPLLPAAIESLPLEQYDLVISSSSCVAKGVITAPQAKHLCYLHSPMRYIWDQRHEYLAPLRRLPGAAGLVHLLSSRLRLWDAASSCRADQYLVNSRFIAQRVEKFYGRSDSQVVYPPIELERFFKARQSVRPAAEPYFLAAGAMVSYKRFDLAIAACKELGRKLVVAGGGPLLNQLRERADGSPLIEFIESPDNQTWDAWMAHAEALLFCGIEDFGMTAIEALAAGTPVIAADAGGALDFVRPGVNGALFKAGSQADLVETLRRFRPQELALDTPEALRERFSEARFLEEIKTAIAKL